MKTIVINLLGGPGVGKTTLFASIFSALKMKGLDVEMAPEYVKDLVWEESFKKIENQIYIMGKQHNRLFRLKNKVQVIITDSPLLNSIVYYTGKNPHFKEMVLWEFNQMDSLNYLFERSFKYEQNGRYQDEKGAIEMDNKFYNLLEENKIPYKKIKPGIDSLESIVQDILEKIC